MAEGSEKSKKTVRELFGEEKQGARKAPLAREFGFKKADVDIEKRTVALSFSSEAPVLRYDMRGQPFYEVLDHESVDMRDMKEGAPLLYGHDRRDHLGTILDAGIGPDKKGRAIVKFSRAKFADEKFQDVQDGILTKTSVGYDLTDSDIVEDGEREGIPVIRFRNWRPYEATLCPLPADYSVGVGRAQSETARTAAPAAKPNSSISMATESTAAAADTSATTASRTAAAAPDYTAERQRMKDINAAAKTLSERHPSHAEAFRSLAAKCGETGDALDVFNRTVLNDILATERTLAPVRQDAEAARVGLSKKDIKRYSIMGAIRAIAEGKPLGGLERECNDELTKKLERQPLGFFLPDEVAAHRRSVRTNLAQSPADGGFTVDQDIMASELVTYLRNNAVVASLGARTIGGLVGNVSIPRQLTGATAYWTDESQALTQSSATFGQIVAKPRRIGTSVPYSKQFIAQTTLDGESFIVNDSDASIALDIDRVALRGNGGVEPLGIANLATADRSTSVTFGAAATWAKYLTFFQNVAASNALLGTPAYVASVASAVKAMTIPKFTNTGFPIWDDDKVGVFQARWTTQLLTSATPVADMVIFGDFSQVMLLEWAGRDVVVDPFSFKKEGNIEVTISRLMDVVIRRSKSFAISTDSGAQ